MPKIKFYLEQQGVQQVIYNNAKLESLERQVIEGAKSQVEAAFLRDFGTVGHFEIKFVRTKVGGKGAAYVNGTRPVYRLVPADAGTTALLKKQPRWLEQFSQGAKF